MFHDLTVERATQHARMASRDAVSQQRKIVETFGPRLPVFHLLEDSSQC